MLIRHLMRHPLDMLCTGFRNPFRVKVLPDDSVYVSDTGSGIEIGERL